MKERDVSEAVLEIVGLKTEFRTRRGVVKAVDGLDVALHPGETFGLVGESGCGKSVTALSILRLLPKPAGRIAAGRILFNGQDLVAASEAEIRRIRGNRISMIFQEPMTSLNPVYTIGFQIEEVLHKHRGMKRVDARIEAARMLGLVGMPEPAARLDDYPHQLSGGMRQRAMIAMALACLPALMIADEPTTALDVTIQAQILDLIARLKEEIGMAVLLITHDLGVVAEICRNVAVMYAGRVVESAPVDDIFRRPAHPYTVGLFNSLPGVGGRGGGLKPIPGVVPSLASLPPGCAFQDRCFRRHAACDQEPPWQSIAVGHHARCWKPVE
ncbi:MAG: ABC transporter ATP-binding protein [Desulfobacterales bacterium]|nr:ABC transporter ATP-binding protein [Desulfobacterales bacterium]